ncbi:MAG: divalent-cation tolerance protein CutA [Pseudomonadota bacterium]
MTRLETEAVSIYLVCSSLEEAKGIARAAVEERYVACVNILGPVTSVYRWEGAIEEAAEVAVLMKCRNDAIDDLKAFVTERHSYDVPAFVVWPIVDGLPEYLA